LATIGLLGARVLAFGISDQLVIEIRGSRSEAARYVPLFHGLLAVGIVSAAASTVAPGPWVAAALTLVLLAGSVLEGLLRSCAPDHYERLTNLAPMLFLAACLGDRPTSAYRLVGLFTGATILAQMLSAAGSGVGVGRVRTVRALSVVSLVKLARRGIGKMLAELTLLANIRAVLLWPKLLAGTLASDSIAFAVTIAEAASTIPMVVVNRNYARFANTPGPSAPPVWSAAGAVLLMAAFGSIALALPALERFLDVAILMRVRVPDVAWAMAYLGVITAYYDLRYHAWSQGVPSRPFNAAQLGFFALQGAVVWVLPASAHLAAISLCAGLFLLAWVVVAQVSRGR
jgi:hypothetical protein